MAPAPDRQKDPLFHSRLIRQPGRGQTCLKPIEGLSHKDTKSHQGHEIAEALWCRLSLKEVHLSSGLFVFIRVHSWFN